MTVDCPSCATSFPVDPKKIPAGGVHARCSVCEHVFFVDEPVSETAPPLTAPPDEPPVGAAAQEVALEGVEAEVEPGPTPEAEISEEFPSEAGDEPLEEGPVFGQADPSMAEVADFKVEPETLYDEAVYHEPEPEPAEVDTELVEPEEARPAPEAEGEEVSVSEALPGVEEPPPAAPEEQLEPAFEAEEPTFGEGETTFDIGVPSSEEPQEVEGGLGEVGVEEAPSPEPTPAPAEPPVSEAPPPPPAGHLPTPTFGKRDPKEKAQRLARVLVSDIILYNPDRHQRALSEGRIKEEFEDEIEKSWNEYIEQVGDEIANSTDFFNEALNEILAKGHRLF